MTRDDVLSLCAAQPGAVEDYPFGEGVAVFKVAGRMFALIPLDGAIDDGELRGMIDHSYELVVANLPAADRNRLHSN